MEAGRAFQILAVRIRDEDAKRFVRVREIKDRYWGKWKLEGPAPDLSGTDQKRRCEALRTPPRYIYHVGMQILTVTRGSMVENNIVRRPGCLRILHNVLKGVWSPLIRTGLA
ncbi:jg1914 [Pararge aegeria aegeria]|uniref:Jg1914 protein n=1 Tax=Pararge aegeria aegeria TaxID=348720 RepID=A0A8S4R514_9NEOP|nr:jg1914 [Pararge aegeria aegeria]